MPVLYSNYYYIIAYRVRLLKPKGCIILLNIKKKAIFSQEILSLVSKSFLQFLRLIIVMVMLRLLSFDQATIRRNSTVSAHVTPDPVFADTKKAFFFINMCSKSYQMDRLLSLWLLCDAILYLCYNVVIMNLLFSYFFNGILL